MGRGFKIHLPLKERIAAQAKRLREQAAEFCEEDGLREELLSRARDHEAASLQVNEWLALFRLELSERDSGGKTALMQNLRLDRLPIRRQ